MNKNPFVLRKPGVLSLAKGAGLSRRTNRKIVGYRSPFETRLRCAKPLLRANGSHIGAASEPEGA